MTREQICAAAYQMRANGVNWDRIALRFRMAPNTIRQMLEWKDPKPKRPMIRNRRPPRTLSVDDVGIPSESITDDLIRMDLAFCNAMQNAIVAGTENPHIGTIKASETDIHPIRTIHPAPYLPPTQSVAADLVR